MPLTRARYSKVRACPVGSSIYPGACAYCYLFILVNLAKIRAPDYFSLWVLLCDCLLTTYWDSRLYASLKSSKMGSISTLSALVGFILCQCGPSCLHNRFRDWGYSASYQDSCSRSEHLLRWEHYRWYSRAVYDKPDAVELERQNTFFWAPSSILIVSCGRISDCARPKIGLLESWISYFCEISRRGSSQRRRLRIAPLRSLLSYLHRLINHLIVYQL